MTGDSIGRVQGRQHLGELLVNLRKIDRSQLEQALAEQAKLNVKLGEVLVGKGIVTQQELDTALAIQNNRSPQAPMLARKQLGELLLESGKLTTAQLQAALEAQDLTKQKIGEVLIQMGFVTERDIDSALSTQDSLAFSSRQRILDSLEARNAGEAVRARQTGPLPRELAEAFPSQAKFLEAAGARAFAQAFGREPSAEELGEFKAKLGFAVPGYRPNDPLPAALNRAQALAELARHFQNMVADRIIRLAGGDQVQKVYDRQGNVEVTGLSQQDLELAIELATQVGFQPQEALEQFLASSPRAFFKTLLERSFQSAEEEDYLLTLLEGPQQAFVRDALRRLQGLLRDTFAAFPLARSDKAIRESLTLDEQELRDYLAALQEFGEQEALRLFQEKEFWFRKLELAHQTEGMLRAQLETIKAEQQLRKILDLIERILGSIPAALLRFIKQLMSMVGSQEIPNLGALEALILNLIEQIMQAFQAQLGRTPNQQELAQGLEMALESFLSGGNPTDAIGQFTRAVKEGKSPQGGLPMGKAVQLVNQMNFEFLGQISGSVDEQDPWVGALVTGEQTPATMRTAYEAYYKGAGRGIGLPEALGFVEFLHLSYRGAKLEADPFDPDVQGLMTGALTPGELDRDWKARFERRIPDPV